MKSDAEEIVRRNSLRREAGLPQLDISTEVTKLESNRVQATFELEFELNRHRFEHLWSDTSLNWLSRMGRWNAARKQLRSELMARE